MPRLLLTRPEADSCALADMLSGQGVDSVVAPLMRVANIPGPMLELETVRGFLLTSANGVRALVSRTDRRDIPVFAVGDATARAAEAVGFAEVASAGGDIDDLADLVRARCLPGDGVLLHAAGSVIAGDLAAELEPHGFKVWREMLYEAVAAETIPDEAQRALASNAVDGVVLYSPRTAKLFEALVAKAALTASLSGLRLFALSENVSRASPSAWRERIVAEKPDQESLLNAVRACY